jgi:hypothetical protein
MGCRQKVCDISVIKTRRKEINTMNRKDVSTVSKKCIDDRQRISRGITYVRIATMLLLSGSCLLVLPGCSKPDKYVNFYEGDQRPLKEMAVVYPGWDLVTISEIDGREVSRPFQFVGGVFGGNRYLVLQPGEHRFTASYSAIIFGLVRNFNVYGEPIQKSLQLRNGYLYLPCLRLEDKQWTYNFSEVNLNTCMRDDQINWLAMLKELDKQRRSGAVIEGEQKKASLIVTVIPN